ncbi:hypothetical protein PLICRDRAFT_176807 [Plicaturopsis crispa FD-325 SS-3]|nr:hypothetical protein PLICRDRAFT_176807 [Plicaturopsis crispa FD-325 SS-3]
MPAPSAAHDEPAPVQLSEKPSPSPKDVRDKDADVESGSVSTAPQNDTDPFPDGGYGWVCVLCSFIYHFFAIGIESSWGVYQRYFFDSGVFPGASNAQLAWVGSLQATGVPVAGIFAGAVTQRIGYRLTLLLGSCVMALGFVLASFSTRVWHLYLTQGIIFGLGSGLAYIPAVSVISQWFDKRRGLATGIAVGGSGVGGVFLSPLTQLFIDRLGFRWALRITGLLSLCALSLAGLFVRTRTQKSGGAQKKSCDLRLTRDVVFICLCSVGVFSGFGFYTPSFYVPDYATNNLGLTAADGATSVALISALSALGRVILGLVGDKCGHVNALAVCQGMGAVAQMAVWPFARGRAGLMGFCALYGFFSGGFVSLYPVVAADMYGTEYIAHVTGWLFSGYIPGTLTAPPIAGALLDKYTTHPGGHINFVPAQMLSGGAMAAAASMAVVAKLLHARRGSSR